MWGAMGDPRRITSGSITLPPRGQAKDPAQAPYPQGKLGYTRGLLPHTLVPHFPSLFSPHCLFPICSSLT